MQNNCMLIKSALKINDVCCKDFFYDSIIFFVLKFLFKCINVRCVCMCVHVRAFVSVCVRVCKWVRNLHNKETHFSSHIFHNRHIQFSEFKKAVWRPITDYFNFLL